MEAMFEDHPLLTVIQRTTPKASKQYVCAFCRGVINKGEVHAKSIIKEDDNNAFLSVRHHIVCERLF